MTTKFIKIETLPELKMLGFCSAMTLEKNAILTKALWQKFMKVYIAANGSIRHDLFSIQLFDKAIDYNNINANTTFVKWAAAESSRFKNRPNSMGTIVIPQGKYAVFNHFGPASTFYKTIDFIHKEWLPNSKFVIDARPHFEVLGKKYKPNNSDSEETIWIPVV